MKKKSLNDFVELHGMAKVTDLEKRLALAEAKVESLSSSMRRIHVVKRPENTFKFAAVGDLHYGSLYHDPDVMHAFMEYAVSQGVNHLMITGDILDGHKIYKGQDMELKDVGFERQFKRLVDEFPKVPGMHVDFITGNHDASFKKEAGVPVGQLIAREMGWEFHGEDIGDVQFDYPGGVFRVRMIHPGQATAYAVSYRSQKIVEKLSGDLKPNILLIGHTHKADMLPTIRNVCAVQTGCIQLQTPFMARQALDANVGGWIFNVSASNMKENYTVFSHEFIAFYS